MSEHTNTTRVESRKPAASRRKTAARKPRPKKSGPGAGGQRDAYGRFQAGNPGGYGNPYARQVAMLRRELMQRTRPAEIREIGNKLLSLAKAGNVQAAKVILSYTLGLPTPAQPPDRVDADEMSLFSEEIELQENLNEQLKNPGLEVHLRHIRSRRQYYAYLAAKMFVGAYTATPEEKKRHAEETAGMTAEQRALRCAELGKAKHWLPFTQQELLHQPWVPWPAEEAPAKEAPTTEAPVKDAAAADAASQAAAPSHADNHHAANGHGNRAQRGKHADDGAVPNSAVRNGPAHDATAHDATAHNATAHDTTAEFLARCAAEFAAASPALKNRLAQLFATPTGAPSTDGVSRGLAANPNATGARPHAPAAPAQTAVSQHVASAPAGPATPSANGSNGKHPAAAPTGNGASPGIGKRRAAAAPPKKRTISARTRNILPKELRPRGMIVPTF